MEIFSLFFEQTQLLSYIFDHDFGLFVIGFPDRRFAADAFGILLDAGLEGDIIAFHGLYGFLFRLKRILYSRILHQRDDSLQRGIHFGEHIRLLRAVDLYARYLVLES